MKTMVQNLYLVKSYDQTNLTDFFFGLREKYRWGLTSFGQYIIWWESCRVAILWVISHQVLLINIQQLLQYIIRRIIALHMRII